MRSKLFSFFMVACTAVVISCNAQKSLSPKEFSAAVAKDPKAMVLDVRTANEYEQENHLQNALSLDWQAKDFEVRADQLDRATPLYVYCHSGRRSAAASEKLKAMGFKHVYNMDGGITAWEEAGLPVTQSKPR